LRLIPLYICLCLSIWLQGQTLPLRPGTALNKVVLYPDSSFFAHSNIFYEEGTLFEVLAETRFEHEDEAQNQKFKWYQVKAPDDKISDDLAATSLWVAGIEGKDNFHEDDYLNPLYKEYYLVLTSRLGKSYHIQFAGESAMGQSELRAFVLQDLTADNIPELLFLKSNLDTDSRLENRVVEIFSFQAGSIAKVFEEKMDLTYAPRERSPALFKFIEIDEQTIRVAYVDYLACTDYSLMLTPKELNKTNEKCLEYVTYSFVWQAATQTYQPLYEESRTAIEGQLIPEKGFLRSEPTYLSTVVEKLAPKSTLKVVQHFEKIITQRGNKKVVPYLYVQSPNGNYGYIHAKDVQLQVGEHATILNRFYKNPPLNKLDWTLDTNFLSIKIAESNTILTKKE